MIYLTSFLVYGSNASQNPVVIALNDVTVGTAVTVGLWVFFFPIFYLIGKRVDFRRDYGNLGILIYGGILASYFLFELAFGAGGGLSSQLVRQDISNLVSAVAGFGLLFGAMSLAFVRTQLPSSDSPPLELMAYRKPALVGLVAFSTSFASHVLSGFIAALLFQEGLFREDQFAFLNYYYGGDPLFVNYIIYPGLFMVFLYYMGREVDFHRKVRQVFLFLFAGGSIGYVIGTPLGAFLKVFFNPPPNSSSASAVASLSQLYAINAQSVVTSVLEAALLTFLGVSVLTIALLLRQSDLPTDDEEEDGGYVEAVPTPRGHDDANSSMGS